MPNRYKCWPAARFAGGWPVMLYLLADRDELLRRLAELN